MKYADKLKDPRWQKKRLEVFERDEWRCQSCQDTETTLCVHHLRYISGHDPWDYPNELLITLCETCHSEEHEWMPETIGTLADTIKDKGFLSDGVLNIARGFWFLELKYPQDVVSSIIEHALASEDVFEEMANHYFAYCQELSTAAEAARKARRKGEAKT